MRDIYGTMEHPVTPIKYINDTYLASTDTNLTISEYKDPFCLLVLNKYGYSCGLMSRLLCDWCDFAKPN